MISSEGMLGSVGAVSMSSSLAETGEAEELSQGHTALGESDQGPHVNNRAILTASVPFLQHCLCGLFWVEGTQRTCKVTC